MTNGGENSRSLQLLSFIFLDAFFHTQKRLLFLYPDLFLSLFFWKIISFSIFGCLQYIEEYSPATARISLGSLSL